MSSKSKSKYNLSAIWVFPQVLSCSLSNQPVESRLVTGVWFKRKHAAGIHNTIPFHSGLYASSQCATLAA